MLSVSALRKTKRVNRSKLNDLLDYAEYISEGDNLDSVASVNSDGRISIFFDLKHGMPELSKETRDYREEVEEFGIDKREWKDCPNMNILIMIVGSRGVCEFRDFQIYIY